MPTLHMEVETARSTQGNLTNTHSQLISLIQSLTGAVNNLRPAWMGNSATEFFGEYDQWSKVSNDLTAQLETLSSRLAREIQEWEDMASKLNG